MILLQVVTDTTSIETVGQSISVLDLALEGGFMMVPIFILSVIAIYLFFERLMIINKALGGTNSNFDPVHCAIVEAENVDLFTEVIVQDVCEIIQLQKTWRLCVSEEGVAGHERTVTKQNEHVTLRLVMSAREIQEPAKRRSDSLLTWGMRST